MWKVYKMITYSTIPPPIKSIWPLFSCSVLGSVFDHKTEPVDV
jgi:hypothetical protein